MRGVHRALVWPFTGPWEEQSATGSLGLEQAWLSGCRLRGPFGHFCF